MPGVARERQVRTPNHPPIASATSNAASRIRFLRVWRFDLPATSSGSEMLKRS